MKRPLKSKEPHEIDWGKAFAAAIAQERDKDAARAVELIRELYWLVIMKHHVEDEVIKKYKKK
jgi:hypothetical protein